MNYELQGYDGWSECVLLWIETIKQKEPWLKGGRLLIVPQAFPILKIFNSVLKIKVKCHLSFIQHSCNKTFSFLNV